MRIVKPTSPPSMAVVVDPIITEPITLSIKPAHAVENRIDIVYVRDGEVGILYGAGTTGYPSPPIPRVGMRQLAEIHVPNNSWCVLMRNIMEND